MFLKNLCRSFINKLSIRQNIHIQSSRFKHVKLSYSIFDGKDFKNNPSTISSSKNSMLIIHGLFGNKNNFESLAKSFAKKTGVQVITVDVRNHGKSGHGDEMDYMTMSEDMCHLMFNDLSLSHCIVLGHSMGGKIAMTMALNRPELVSGLVVVDINPGLSVNKENDFFPTLMRKMMEIDFTGKSYSDARKFALEELASVVKDKRVIDFLMTNVDISEEGKVQWRLNVPSLLNNLPNIVSFPPHQGLQYNKPTLFIGGSLSNYLKPENHESIKTYFPPATITMIQNAGHWVHADDPVNFSNHVVQFIRSMEPTN